MEGKRARADGGPAELGARGEELAARHLRSLGYTIRARNYRFGRREIDLIVQSGDLIAFVEVKTRAGRGFGHPLEAITALKRREVERVARAWHGRHGAPDQRYRFDAVGLVIEPGGEALITHVPGAWRLGE